VLTSRHPTARVVVRAARVQGDGAALDLVRALRAMARVPEVDVVIIGRGGGSAEDLWAFNDEALARAIAACPVPVISAVGHETDFTIADFAADLRAPTPSAAAELVAAHERELCARLDQLIGGLQRTLRHRVAAERAHVRELTFARGFDEVRSKLRDALASVTTRENRLHDAIARMFQNRYRRFDAAARLLSPSELRNRAVTQRARLDSVTRAHDAAMISRLEKLRQQFGFSVAALEAMSPLKVLERGYAIAHDAAGKIVRDASAASVGAELRVRLWKGELGCRVEDIHHKDTKSLRPTDG